jgi:DNA polymerase/3'-5' exonuclease PolX
LNKSIRDIYKRGKLREIPGVGASIAKIIKDFLVTGRSEKLEEFEVSTDATPKSYSGMP